MSATPTPVLLYDAGGKVIGPQGGVRALLQFYRPIPVLDLGGIDYVAPVIPFGSEATGGNTVGGTIAVAKCSIDWNSVNHNTTGRYGQSNNDNTAMRGDPTLNLGSFVQAQGQPTLMPGDYCAISIGMKITSTSLNPVPAALTRWFIGSNGLSTDGPNQWSLKLTFDRPNSDPNFNLW